MSVRQQFAALAIFILGVASAARSEEPQARPQRLAPPGDGKLYHGVYPGGKSGEEDDITRADLAGYEKNVQRQVAWVYFSHNWFREREFPLKTARWIRDAGAVPYIRLMLRSDAEEDHAEELFTLQAIAAGKFDADLKKWAEQAREFATPLLVEWGTECNGEWFPWNGVWNGSREGDAKAEGPRRFVAAYRHLVDTFHKAGARNISWVFHVNSADVPKDDWNRLENYYPGDAYVDWLAVSVYGPKTPADADREAKPFARQMEKVYSRLVKLAPEKPVIVAEFGCTAGHERVSPEDWASAALEELLSRRWPKVAGFSWWNERWENGRRREATTMRVQDIPALAQVFRAKLNEAKEKIQDRPINTPAEK